MRYRMWHCHRCGRLSRGSDTSNLPHGKSGSRGDRVSASPRRGAGAWPPPFETDRRKIDAHLAARLARLPGVPPRLARALRHAALAPGKRLRPLLVLLGYDAVGGERARRRHAIAAAAAVELVHAFSLVHDDLPALDDDDLRRGRPTLHKAFDEATAILAGDDRGRLVE